MSDAVEEYLKFTIAIKTDEMKRGLESILAQIKTFDQQAKAELGQVGIAFDTLDKRAKALQLSMTASLAGLQKEMHLLSATSRKVFTDLDPNMNKANFANYIGQLMQVGQASRQAATGMERLQTQQNALANAPKPDWDAAAAAALKEAEASRKMAEEVKRANEQIASSTRSTSATVKQELDKEAKAAADTGKAGKKMADDWTNSLKAMESALSGVAMVAGTTMAALAASGGYSAKAFGDLEAEANTFTAISGATGAEVDALSDKAMKLAESTGFATAEVVRAGTELARLGFTSQEVEESISSIALAARASGESIDSTGELIGGVLRGFNLQTKDTQHVSDVLSKAANVSALSFSTLQNSMKYVAPVAASANQSLEDMTAILGVLADNMIKGEPAGTATRSMLDSLINPSKEAKDRLTDLGITMEDQAGKMKPLKQIFSELSVALKDYKDIAKGQILGDIFGLTASTASLVLIDKINDKLPEMRQKLNDVSGETEKVAGIMNQGLNAELAILRTKANNVAITLGEDLAPAVTECVKFLQGLLDLIAGIPKPARDAAIQVGILATAVTGLSFAFSGSVLAGGKMIGVMSQIIEKAPALRAALALLGGPVGIAATAVGLAGNFALNYGADLINHQTDLRDSESERMGKQADGQKKVNALLNKSQGGKNLGLLSASDLKDGLAAIKQATEALGEQLKVEKDLEALRSELRSKEGGYSAGGQQPTSKQNEELRIIRQKIKNKEAEVSAASDGLKKAHDLTKKYGELKSSFETELKKRPTTPEGTENAPDKDADRQADQAAQKRVDALVEKHQRETAALKTELDKQLALVAANSQKIGTIDDAMSQKLIANSEKVKLDGISCFASVYKAYKDTFGDGGMFDKMVDKGDYHVPNGNNARDAADAAARLAEDKRFHEVEINAQNYRQVMANLKAASIIVYDRGAGFSNATARHGHIETYDPKTGMASYGKGAGKMEMNANRAAHARIFEMNTSSAGGGVDIQKMLVQQQALIKQTEDYKRQLAEMKALRDQQTEGSDAWLKADKAAFDIQQKIDQAGVDSIEGRAELLKKQREEALRWAQESLSIEADVAEAKAKLTSDTFDDIQASHQKALAALRSEEMGRLAQEGTTEEQRLKIKQKYDALRLVAEKAYSDAITAERYALTRSTEDILAAAESSEAALMQEGLEKDIRLSEIRQANEKMRLRRQLQDMDSKGKSETDDYALVQQTLNELTQKGEEERAEIRRQFFGRRRLEELSSDQADVDFNLRKELVGQKDPEAIARAQGQALMAKLHIQEDISGEIWAQLETAKAEAKVKGQSAESSEKIFKLQQQLRQSERAEGDIKLQSQDVLLQLLERERQIRQQINQGILQGIDAQTEGFAKMLGFQQGAGRQAATVADLFQKSVALFKDKKGNSADFKDIFSVDQATGGMKGLDALKGFSFKGDVSSVFDIALKLNDIKEQFVGWLNQSTMDNIIAHSPQKIRENAAALKAQLLQIDLDIQDSRIAQAKARGVDTYNMEKDQLAARRDAELNEVDRQWQEIRHKKSGWGVFENTHTPEELKARREFEAAMPGKKLAIEEKYQATSLQMEKDKLERVLNANVSTAQAIADARLNAESQTAALTPGGKDDRAAEKSRREAEVWKTYLGRINTAMEQAGSGNWEGVGALVLAAGKEKDSSLAGMDNDLRLKRLQEEAKIRGEIAQTREMEINLNLKGASKEIELLREKIRLEQASLEDQMKDPSLSPEEYQAKERRRALLQDTLDKSEKDVPRKWANAAANAAIDLTAEIAKGTKTGLDDAVADYEAALQKISEAEEDARENLEGPQLESTLRKLSQARINAEKDTQKKLKEIWLQEYTERLNQQKALIQEQLELNSRGMEDQIRDIQIAMRPLQAELENMQRLLDASRRAREAEKKVYNPGDGKRNPKFKSDLAALDADPLAWAGVKEIANTATHDGLPTVSGKTKREGLLKEAELQELEANNELADERITESEFAQKMQRAQLIRAKAAEMELATADLTRTRKLELEKEWAEAYANWQKYASDAIDARYDADDQRTQENMDLKQLALDQQQQSIDALQLQLDTLQDAAEKKIRPIDDEILRATQSTRDWAPAWAEVTAGIAAARKEAEALLAAQERAASKATAKTSSLTRTKTPDATHTVAGTDGYYYQTTSQMQGLADGGIVPNKGRYAGDKYGPVMLDQFEAVIPLRRLPELIRPWMPPPAKNYASSFSPQITISGNTIVGEFDMYNVAYRAASDLQRENNNTFAGNAGHMF